MRPSFLRRIWPWLQVATQANGGNPANGRIPGAAPHHTERSAPTNVQRGTIRRLLFWNFNAVHRGDRWMKRRFSSAGRLLLGATVLGMVFGINTRAAVAYQLAVLGLSLIFCAMLWAPAFRVRLEVRRLLPSHARVGVPFSYTISVHNRGARAATGVQVLDELGLSPETLSARHAQFTSEDYRRNWFDRHVGYPRWAALVRQGRGAVLAPVAMSSVAAGERTTVRVPVVALRRGFLRFREMRFFKADPLGIFNGECLIPSRASVLVLPRSHPVRWPNADGYRAREDVGVTESNRLGGSGEFASVREYRSGDSLRRLHWRGWARYGFPVVKEFHDQRQARRAVLMDAEFGPGTSYADFEAAVEVAASFCQADGAAHSNCSLILGTESPQRIDGNDGDSETPLLEALACVEPAAQGSFARFQDFVTRGDRQP